MSDFFLPQTTEELFGLRPPEVEPTLDDLRDIKKYLSKLEKDPQVLESGIVLIKMPVDWKPCKRTHDFGENYEVFMEYFNFQPKVQTFISECVCSNK